MAYTKKAEATRARILDIAANLIMENGYSEMRLDQVLSQARVQKGNFYYYFESKADMSHAAVREVIIPKALAWVDELTGKSALSRGITGFLGALGGSVESRQSLVTSPLGVFIDLGNANPALARTYTDFLAALAAKFSGLQSASGGSVDSGAFANLLVGAMAEYKATRDAGRLLGCLAKALGAS